MYLYPMLCDTRYFVVDEARWYLRWGFRCRRRNHYYPHNYSLWVSYWNRWP